MATTITAVRETVAGERRVALTPETAKKLKARGARIVLQDGIGASAYFADAGYVDCEIADAHAVLAQADGLSEPGAVGALLRREGLYSTHPAV